MDLWRTANRDAVPWSSRYPDICSSVSRENDVRLARRLKVDISGEIDINSRSRVFSIPDSPSYVGDVETD